MPPSNFFPTFSHPKTQKAKRDSLLPAVVERGGNRRVTLNAWKRNSLILATTANICHPAPGSVRAPPGPLPKPHARRFSSSPAFPGPPMSGTRLGASSSPASPTLTLPGPPRPHCRFQYNGMSLPRTRPSPPRPSRRQSRVSVIAELSHGPKLHHVRAQDTGGDGDPRLPPRPTSRISPGRESRTGRPHPSRVHPTGVISHLSGGGEDQETRGGFPPGPDPTAVLHRGEGPKCIPGLSWPTRTPPPTLPTWP